jgi:hypothetical protein
MIYPLNIVIFHSFFVCLPEGTIDIHLAMVTQWFLARSSASEWPTHPLSACEAVGRAVEGFAVSVHRKATHFGKAHLETNHDRLLGLMLEQKKPWHTMAHPSSVDEKAPRI